MEAWSWVDVCPVWYKSIGTSVAHYLRVQSVSQLDDMFSREGLEEESSLDLSRTAPGTTHHPQSSQLCDRGVVLIVSGTSLYEYDCPTHSAAELRALSQQLQRVEGSTGSLDTLQFHASDVFKRLEEHVKLHRESVKNMTSKLWFSVCECALWLQILMQCQNSTIKCKHNTRNQSWQF